MFPIYHFVTPTAIALPPVVGWAIAVWGAGKFQWGVASGMSVGLFVTCVTFKAMSFAREANGIVGDGACDTHVRKGVTALNKTEGKKVVDERLRQIVPLTFAEFACFMLVVPSLLCESAYLQRAARRPRRLMRAASEFFYAGLCFLAFHASLSALFAPALRVMARALFFADAGEGTEPEANTSDWVDLDGWAVITANGNGWWFSGEGGWLEVGVAVVFSMVVCSPMVHFMVFYGFWHCLCLGFAELCGYPDRNFYGEGLMRSAWSIYVGRVLP